MYARPTLAGTKHSTKRNPNAPGIHIIVEQSVKRVAHPRDRVLELARDQSSNVALRLPAERCEKWELQKNRYIHFCSTRIEQIALIAYPVRQQPNGIRRKIEYTGLVRQSPQIGSDASRTLHRITAAFTVVRSILS